MIADVRPALTVPELNAMDLTAALVNLVCRDVIAHGPSRDGDIREFVAHIHVIQQMILSQAAGRCYPDHFRLLGEAFTPVQP